MDSLQFVNDYVNTNMKEFNISNDEIESIQNEYISKLVELQKYFKYKCNIKTFNYFENNIIFNIFRNLQFNELTILSQVSKKYNTLLKSYDFLNYILVLDSIYQYKFIDIYSNLKFHFDFTPYKKKLKRDVIKFKNAHSLVLPYYRNKDISFLTNVKKLTITCSYYFEDISSLLNVTSLNLTCCNGISNENLQILGNGSIKFLNLSGTRITDVSNFLNIESLVFSNCYELKDVSPLKDSKILKYLNISYNRHINDISMLTNVKILNIFSCSNISIKHLENFKNKFKGTLRDGR
jgi:hypothetical protein